ncbi:MAG: tRNA guanosine(34) transglycosylase Tgt [Coriobacteriales bacterium]|jgi:queuine tRNA-ribosyltransferase|nr:tRNA guanosine(34) transglycosylase Tgt [Coriobacteriales bacterium]
MTGKPFAYRVVAKDRVSSARAGVLDTPHGLVETPTFMPVGTRASVKALTQSQLNQLGTQVVLANAYHLYLRPGAPVIADAGGLHHFMGRQGPILTDSGGFQVFSLKKTVRSDDEGISFKSILDGSAHRWTPEDNMHIQERLGADIIMQLDVCSPYPAKRDEVAVAVERSAAWAGRCRQAHTTQDQALFAIVQGGVFDDLRSRSVAALLEIEERFGRFEGFGIGGYSVGEPHRIMLKGLAVLLPKLPQDRPRYLMGVGNPTSILLAIGHGVDMFDSVLPTRTARMGTAFSHAGRLNMRNSCFATDYGPLDAQCNCEVCTSYSRAYLRHLIVSKEIAGAVLLSIHNLHFLLDLTRRARAAVLRGGFAAFLSQWLDSPAAHDY